MGPSRPLRLVARDRARRNPGSRIAHAPFYQGKAWWDAKLVSMLQHHLLGSIRGSIREPDVHLAAAAPKSSPASDGHIISLGSGH